MLRRTNVAARVKLLTMCVMCKYCHWGACAALVVSYSAGCVDVFKGLLLKGNVAEKGLRGRLLLLQQQGNTAPIWHMGDFTQSHTVRQLMPSVHLASDSPLVYEGGAWVSNRLQQSADNLLFLPILWNLVRSCRQNSGRESNGYLCLHLQHLWDFYLKYPF